MELVWLCLSLIMLIIVYDVVDRDWILSRKWNELNVTDLMLRVVLIYWKSSAFEVEEKIEKNETKWDKFKFGVVSARLANINEFFMIVDVNELRVVVGTGDWWLDFFLVSLESRTTLFPPKHGRAVWSGERSRIKPGTLWSTNNQQHNEWKKSTYSLWKILKMLKFFILLNLECETLSN